MEHKAPTRHTPTKDRMSLKRCRDQWPGIPFPVSGQRRVTRRYRVTRTRNFSKNTKGRPEHREGQEEAKKEDRMARKDIDDGKDEEEEETGRPNVGLFPSYVPHCLFFLPLDRTRYIHQIDLTIPPRSHRRNVTKNVYRLCNICATVPAFWVTR